MDSASGAKGEGGSSTLIPLFILTACVGLVALLNILSVFPTPPGALPRMKKTIFQESVNGCGPAALAMVFADHGISWSPSEIGASLPSNGEGVSMLDLRRCAEAKGLSAAGWRLAASDLRSVPMPVILLVSGGHFIVVDSVDGKGRVLCRDPESGNMLYPRDVLDAMWHGEALVFGSYRH